LLSPEPVTRGRNGKATTLPIFVADTELLLSLERAACYGSRMAARALARVGMNGAEGAYQAAMGRCTGRYEYMAWQ
jgi:hypothetical protein